MAHHYEVEYTTVNPAYEEGRKNVEVVHRLHRYPEGIIMIWIPFFMDEDETLDFIIWIFITPPKVGVYEHI